MGILYIVKPDKKHYKNLNSSINIDNIYKVGLSHKKRLERLKDYGKDAEWIRSELVKDERYLENVLIKKMKEKYGEPIYGREYFICKNYEDIKFIFSDVIKLDREPNMNSDNNEISKREFIHDKNKKIKCVNCYLFIEKCRCEIPCNICGWWGKHCVCKMPCDMCGWLGKDCICCPTWKCCNKINIVFSHTTEKLIKLFIPDINYKGSKCDNKLNNVYVNDSFFTTVLFNKHKTKLELRFKNGFNVPAMKINNNWYDLDIYIMLSRICPRIKNKMLNSVEIWWDKVIKDGGFMFEGNRIEWNKNLKTNYIKNIRNKKTNTIKVAYEKEWFFKCYCRQTNKGVFNNSSFWRTIQKECMIDIYNEKKIQIDGVRKMYIILPSLEEAKKKWYEIQDSYTYEKYIDWRFKCSKV